VLSSLGRFTARAGLLAVFAALVLLPCVAAAQDECPTDGGNTLPPDYRQLVDFFPSAGATMVPTDGFVRLRYRGQTPRPPVVIVEDLRMGGARVPGDVFVVGEAEIHWQSRGLLRPSTEYRVRAADVAGGTGDNSFTFTTGISPSSAMPPRFDGVAQVEFSANGRGDLCGDPDAVEVTVAFRRATTNGWPASDIEYVIYQTRGPNIGGPVVRARERGRAVGSSCSRTSSGNELCRSFRLSSQNATGPVCFNIQALDPFGRADGNTVERCTDPSVGNYFVGCDVGPAAAHASIAGRPSSRASRLRPWGTAIAVSLLAVLTALHVRRGRADRG
jgi:hypothetical protein